MMDTSVYGIHGCARWCRRILSAYSFAVYACVRTECVCVCENVHGHVSWYFSLDVSLCMTLVPVRISLFLAISGSGLTRSRAGLVQCCHLCDLPQITLLPSTLTFKSFYFLNLQLFFFPNGGERERCLLVTCPSDQPGTRPYIVWGLIVSSGYDRRKKRLIFLKC